MYHLHQANQQQTYNLTRLQLLNGQLPLVTEAHVLHTTLWNIVWKVFIIGEKIKHLHLLLAIL